MTEIQWCDNVMAVLEPNARGQEIHCHNDRHHTLVLKSRIVACVAVAFPFDAPLLSRRIECTLSTVASCCAHADDPIVIITHGGVSRITLCRWILRHGGGAGSQPGSTRSTVTPPSRGPSIPGATSTTLEKRVGSQISPIPSGSKPACE
jgi:hypothetical protein